MRNNRVSFLILLALIVRGANAQAPQVQITNGTVNATVYLPDRDKGYYRGGRFDWSGSIAQLTYAGHNYFGVWFPKYEPTLHDAITGPVEEFRSAEGGLGYGEAKPNEFFVKIGVGVLRKVDDQPYSFARTYPITDTGRWVTRPESDRVRFVQELKGVLGYSYVYTKTVRLGSGKKPDLILEHTLKNTGKRPIDTEVYNHDFYVIDNQPTGPDFTVNFTFAPQPKEDFKGPAEVRGQQLIYQRELAPEKDTASGYLGGYGTTKADNRISVENKKTHAGVTQTIDRPISKLYFWSIQKTLCPEAYIALHVPPGKSVKWTTSFHFYTLPE